MGSTLGDMSKKAKGPGAVSVESLKAQLEALIGEGAKVVLDGNGRMAMAEKQNLSHLDVFFVLWCFFVEENHNGLVERDGFHIFFWSPKT